MMTRPNRTLVEYLARCHYIAHHTYPDLTASTTTWNVTYEMESKNTVIIYIFNLVYLLDCVLAALGERVFLCSSLAH